MIDMLYDEEIADAAEEFGLDKFLVTALVYYESRGNRYAHRVEPAYKYLWNIAKKTPFRPLSLEEQASETPPPDFPAPPGVSQETEWWDQQSSWGLCQVMGAVAREYNYPKYYLTELCSVPDGLHYGCKHLATYWKRYNGDIRKVLAAYNGGPGAAQQSPSPNQFYVDNVIALWAKAKS